jgi:hypothetical protein
LASTLDKKEIADLQDQFEAIDVDRNGVITLEEMKKVCCKHYHQPSVRPIICYLSQGPNLMLGCDFRVISPVFLDMDGCFIGPGRG